MNPRHLYRCRRDRQLAGVAAGMAEYFDLDPTVVRILWILSAFFGGFSILLYIVLAFVIPLEPGSVAGPGSWHAAGPAWGSAPAAGAGTDGADVASGTVPEPGVGTQPNGGVAPPDSRAARPDGRAAVAGWPAPAPDHRHADRRGRAGLYLGVLLVVLGAIALANTVIPGWAGIAWFGPALLVALGVALVAGSIHRASSEPDGSSSAG